MIIVNFKNYKIGKSSLYLAKLIEKINRKIAVAVPAVVLEEISHKTKLKVYAQHADYHSIGRSTGYLVPEEIKQSGAKGTIINHSEHKIPMQTIEKTIKRLKKLRLTSVVCVTNLKEAKQIKKFKPDIMAYEEPKLIATNKSITKYKSNSVKKFARILKNTNTIPLCGAGINSKEDFIEAIRLGCKGVLVSSIVANSKNSSKFLKEIKTLV